MQLQGLGREAGGTRSVHGHISGGEMRQCITSGKVPNSKAAVKRLMTHHELKLMKRLP